MRPFHLAPMILALALALPACTADDEHSADCTGDAVPTADIIQPTNTAEFDSGQVVHFLASVGDDADAPDTLEVEMTSTVIDDVTDLEPPAPDADGRIEFDEHDLADGIHIIDLTVTDSDGCVGVDQSTLKMGD